MSSARELLDVCTSRTSTVAILDLTLYEVGNVLIRRVEADVDDADSVLAHLCATTIVLVPTGPERREAARFALEFGLTFYDAAYLSVARARDVRLATHDRALLALRPASTPMEILTGLRR